MTSKTAYLWGPISSFSGPLAAWLLKKGWSVHIATKSALHFALSPLDLKSSAQATLTTALGGLDSYKTFQDRLRYLEVNETSRGTTYDAIVFCGLPPNFDEPRVSRAPWAAKECQRLMRKFKGTPTFIVSSLWAAIQPDGVVPEETDCERRKPQSHFEAVCQQYEKRILKELYKETPWCLVRLPMIGGNTADGTAINFSGMYTLLEKLYLGSQEQPHKEKQKNLQLAYDPDTMLWFLPVDVAVYIFWRLLEDETRPRICNLVSTQATLNREWLADLAKVLGFKKLTVVERDAYGLPNVLRSMLNDNVLVKTRGLFELMGRYRQPPTLLDIQYFEQLFAFGQAENWGKAVLNNADKSEKLIISQQAVKNYFLDFLPRNIDDELLKRLHASGGSLGFNLQDSPEPSAWVLRASNGGAIVEPHSLSDNTPAVSFHFSAPDILRLIQSEVSFERTLIFGKLKVQGKPAHILKACDFFRRFIKEHPYHPQKHSLESREKRDLQNVIKK